VEGLEAAVHDKGVEGASVVVPYYGRRALVVATAQRTNRRGEAPVDSRKNGSWGRLTMRGRWRCCL
jgi:hypothetical protein